MSQQLGEPRLKQDIIEKLSAEFVIRANVVGTHMLEHDAVVIDYMLFPKPHLVAAGFDAEWFGVECKYIYEGQGGLTKKMNQLCWQSISYGQCTYVVDGAEVRPMFVLMYVGDGLSMATNLEWRTLIHFVQYGNVGKLDFERGRWWMFFGGTAYFYNSYYDGQWHYHKSKCEVGVRRRVGNQAK